MENGKTKNQTESLRLLPSVDALLRAEAAQKLVSQTGARHLARLARAVTDSLRRSLQEKIAAGQMVEHTREDLLAEAEKRLLHLWQSEQSAGLQRVINATGVVIHTNLGRAPLSENARRAVFEKASRYCNLEYSLETGKRGRRGARAEHLLAELTGAEAALIVNNCAAAAFLVLTVLAGAGAGGGEVVISRGELVEIGGDFRVPEVLEQSGAILREVGATNRTRVSDYEKAINEKTRMILRVHPSNYRIVGFTSTPSLKEIAEVAHRNDLILYEDAGSGALFDLSAYGLDEEPVVSQSLAAGADVVTFSGDKLLGGVQAGLIVGRRELVEKLRRHPLYRALRVDKLIYAALEATFEAFRRDTVLQEIPVLKMLSATNGEIRARTLQLAQKLGERLGESAGLRFEITEGNSVIGGGSAPTVQPATTLLALSHEKMPVSRLEETLRLSNPPVITRILEDKVLLDLRTVAETEEAELLEVLADLIKL
ncbi:MAG: L-seryl-tRNA(Sec) selenium transferase [Acidobacteriota bacterium]|nr:L-seryl-tRNA(Sec) selenium transferase [Acidobacteriota bacterium]